MKRFFKIFFLLFIGISNLYSQEKIDKLIDKLSMEKTDSLSSKLSVEIANELMYDDWDRAVNYLKVGEEKAKHSQSAKVIADFYLNAANIYYERDKFDLALSHNLKALEFYQNKDEKILNKIENSLATIYARLNNKEASLKYFRNIHKRNIKSKNPDDLALSYNNLGTLYLNYNDYDSATFYLNKSYKLLLELKDFDLQVKNLANLARLYSGLGKNEEASVYVEKAIEILPKINDVSTRRYIYKVAANYYLENNQADKAILYASSGRDSAIVRLSFINSNLLRILYRAYLQNHQYKLAAETFEEYDFVRENLNIEEKAVNVEKLKIEQDYKLKEEIHKLNNQSKIHLLVIIILSLFLSLLAMFFFYSKKKNKLKQEKLNNELNIARENELKLDLELKNKQLISRVMIDNQNEELHKSVINDLKAFDRNFNKEDVKSVVKNVIRKLESNSNKAAWEEFELRFSNIHESFYRNLQQQHPDLSLFDKKLSAFLKLDLSTKEIAHLTGVSIKSVENSRTKLRKKLNLTNTKLDLNEYISNF